MPAGAYDGRMIGADQLRAARIRAGYTSQKALADALGVSERTVTSWESEGGYVSERREQQVRALLFPPEAPAGLSQYTDFELLIELGRRLERVARREAEMMVRGLVPQEDDQSSDDTPTSGLHRLDSSGMNYPAAGTNLSRAAEGRGPRSLRGKGARDAQRDKDDQ